MDRSATMPVSVSTTTLKSWPASSGTSLAASVNRRPAGMAYARRTIPPLAIAYVT